MKRLAGLLLMLCLSLFLEPASALLSGVVAMPPSASVAYNRSASVSVTWRVNADPGNVGITTVTSGFIQISDPPQDTVYGTIPRTISRSVSPGGQVSITETVLIPRSVILTMVRARDAGGKPFPSFIMQRSFTDDNANFLTASVNLYLSGGSGGLFQVEQMALSFDDMSTVRLVRRDDPLNAVLEIQFTGNGRLRGVWELATPASTSGEPVFSPLRLVQQTLVGNQSTRLRSPVLPTIQEGVYLLRFRVTEPDTGFDPVYVRYLVTQTGKPEEPPASIRVVAPSPGALVTTGTRFEWVTDARAVAWQLEIFSKPAQNALDRLPDLGTTPEGSVSPAVDGPPVTGMMLPGATHATQLSKVVRDHLEPGQGYWWRVRAIGSDGSVIAESTLAEFRSH
jgi:type IV secretory pathway protease TraF